MNEKTGLIGEAEASVEDIEVVGGFITGMGDG